MFLPYGASSEIVFENCSSVAMMCDLIATCMTACRPTCCASAAAEARGIEYLQKSNDLARRRRSAASACSAAPALWFTRGNNCTLSRSACVAVLLAKVEGISPDWPHPFRDQPRRSPPNLEHIGRSRHPLDERR